MNGHWVGKEKFVNCVHVDPERDEQPLSIRKIGQLAKLITSKVQETVKAKRDDLFTNQMGNYCNSLNDPRGTRFRHIPCSFAPLT